MLAQTTEHIFGTQDLHIIPLFLQGGGIMAHRAEQKDKLLALVGQSG